MPGALACRGSHDCASASGCRGRRGEAHAVAVVRDVLGQRIDDACAAAISPDEALVSDLLVYACYRPLWRMACAARLGAEPAHVWPTMLGDVLRVCLHEPLRERDLRVRIASGSPIRDSVSKAVQAQYEENPYPRWQALTRGVVQDIEQRVQRCCPAYVAPPELGGGRVGGGREERRAAYEKGQHLGRGQPVDSLFVAVAAGRVRPDLIRGHDGRTCHLPQG